MCGGMTSVRAPAPAAGEQQAEAKNSGCSCCQNMAVMQPPKEGEQTMPDKEMAAPEAPKANP
jgi:hypothetical protein